ncbi:MAG: hypothetical protein KY455_05730 [Euryarchaeota archaeon]|nr:hypothetical protein [Euryarchaeota archaeon]
MSSRMVGNDADKIKEWMENNAVGGRVTTDTIRFNSNGDLTTDGYSLWEVAYSDGEGTFVPYSG